MPFRFRSRWLPFAAGCSLSVMAPGPLLAQEAAAPVIESPLAGEPQTPEELFEAALLTLRLDRPDVAKRYLDALIAGNPGDEFLLKLRDQYGTATFMELARTEGLQPTGRDLMDRIRAAALARISDPATIDVLIDRLSGTPREQGTALLELKHLGEQAVPHILRRVQSNVASLRQDIAVETLVALEGDAIAPLIGTLQTGPEDLQGLAADALGRIGGPEAEIVLLSPAFSPSSSTALQQSARMALAQMQHGDPNLGELVSSQGARAQLQRQADRYFRQEVSQDTGGDGLVGVWTWDSAQPALVETRTTPDKAALYFAEVYARQAVELGNEERSPQVLLMAVLLARDVAQAGWGDPVPEGPGTAHDLALEAGPELTEEVLKLALAEQRPAAAIAALRVLGQNGSRKQLSAKSAIIDALNASEQRVQFAAAETILQWDPIVSFPQSTRVVEILARALEGDARRDSVVIDPNPQRATLVGGYLNTLGYDPRVVSTGREGFVEASSRGDVALAVVHLNSIRWDLSQTVANLRADARTKSLPIAIYGPPGMESRAQHLENAYPRVRYIRESTNPYEVAEQLRTLVTQVTPPALTQEQREEQRRSAAYWLAHIANGRRTNVFDLSAAEAALSNAVNDADVGRSAIIALAAIASASAQERLLDVSLNSSATPELRSTAARQLGFHIQQYGLLLSGDSLERLRGGVETENDPSLGSALAAVLGSLKPDAALIRERLLSYPSSTPLPPNNEAEAIPSP